MTARREAGRAITRPAIADRPRLASKVSLHGRMEGSGFSESQWLVERDGTFLQLTELLYRVAERADGTRTVEDLAEELTEATDWTFTPEIVKELVHRKLVPLGLVAVGEEQQATASPRRLRSPLQLTLRLKVLGPGAVNPVARALRWLYTPPVLAPVLSLIAVAHIWLYVRHGVRDGLQTVLFRPSLLLAVVGITVASGFVHEFGHATALSYGGGRARGMGMGFYLIFPVFYTDVTESYRLGRAGRVRTDLGGFYFHLILASALIAASAASGVEWLIVPAVLINLDILRQMLPFVRLDGYWTLADLTGMPDFFSQIVPFLRSVLPFRRWKGARLPRLKPWVRVVFLVYIAVAVPVLAFLLFLVVKRLPYVASTAWDSATNQAQLVTSALDRGDVVNAAGSALQIVILAFPLVASGLMLLIVGRFALLGALTARHRERPQQPAPA